MQPLPRLPLDEWRDIRNLVFERDGWECVFCGRRKKLTADHVLPLCKGGTHDPENLQTLCAPCNRAKGEKLIIRGLVTI